MNNQKEILGVEANCKIINGKSIIISGDIHDIMLKYVKTKGTKISYFTEQLFLDFLKNNNIDVNQFKQTKSVK
jgi:hypothetical protein